MMRTAAIDCGTNSIRLLIADVDNTSVNTPALTDVVRLMRVVRLGEGVDATGRLSASALARTFAAVKEYAALIRDNDVQRTRFVATSATRDAANRDQFTDGIRALLGVEPEVVSGDEEAALSFAGAASAVELEGGETALVVDLGGGSTEFVAGTRDGVVAARSMDMGCVRYTERYLVSDPPTESEVKAAQAEAERMVAEALSVLPTRSLARVIGVAGTITTVTAHALGLPGYEPKAIHGSALSRDQVRAAATDLLAMDRRQRAALPYMHPGRVDVIGAGALIWRTVIDHVHALTAGSVDGAVASEHDILDGIALSAARGTKVTQ
jgi:exopolyphosphatase/guanosine-5'-triphosphate,3'-diphosphate pyrophosphatase